MTLTLQKRRLHGHTERRADHKGLDLSCTQAYGSAWIECCFTACDFSLSDFQTARFEDCVFAECKIEMTNFRAASFRHVRFVNCSMRQTAFSAAVPLDGVTFDECKLQYSTFYDSTIRRAEFFNCNLHGADLRFMEANYVEFTGSNLWNAHVQLGCQFFNGHFDLDHTRLFVALAARRHNNDPEATELKKIAHEKMRVVTRLMEEREGDVVHIAAAGG